jgi:hypothetical protein
MQSRNWERGVEIELLKLSLTDKQYSKRIVKSKQPSIEWNKGIIIVVYKGK